MGKQLSLGTRLRYPITIVKLLKKPGDAIAKQEPAMQFSFKWMKEVGDPVRGDTWQEEQTTISDWDSPAEGTLLSWNITEGATIHRDMACMVVDEPCAHEIQFAGMCAVCGKDMTVVDWASEQTDAQRAPINMTHDQTSLMVAKDVAERTEFDAQRRLLAARKLILVVDLDQTIIHACIEPTIGEWQRDPNNPNFEAVREVRSFQLVDDGPRGLASGCSYYIKTRPGLSDFLQSIAELYELHVYTMGTRAYALNIAKIVDPQQKYFGNRVISRDENGSVIYKMLQRLFPVSTDMVVIIDDRADVWPRNREHLIKVVPYDFFKGIGDINSSFLPRRQDILPEPVAIAPQPPVNGAGASPDSGLTATTSPAVTADTSPPAAQASISADVGMSDGEDVELQLQAQEQERSLEKQITDRPLLHMQEELDRVDEQQPADVDHHHNRQHLLGDDDEELLYLLQHLTNLHKTFYKMYDQNTKHRSSKAVKENGEPGGIDLSLVPDVGQVLGRLKAEVLAGTVIVLSGLVPLGVDVLQSEIGLQAVSFGAQLRTKVSKGCTHLVISSSRPRTQKVRQAAKMPHIKIVYQNWLADCLSQWRRVDETPYLVQVHPDDRLQVLVAHNNINNIDATADAETVSEGGDGDGRSARPQLTLIDVAGRERLLGDESDGSDDGDEDADEDDDDDEDDEDDEDDDNARSFAPDDLEEGQTSPIDSLKTFDWGEVDDELAEFLGSDDDEDEDGGGESDADTDMVDQDADGARPEASKTSGALPTRKRKTLGEDGEESGVSDDGLSGTESTLVVKKPRVGGVRRGSPLKVAYTPNGRTTTTTTTTTTTVGELTAVRGDVTVREEVSASSSLSLSQSQGPNGDASAEDDLEADLEAELEAEFA